MSLSQKVAIVTGATSGIGEACARRLAAEGAVVILASRRDAIGEAIAADIRHAGGRAGFCHLDVTDESEWAAVVEFAEGVGDGLHVLVNNAGIGLPSPLTSTSLEQFRLMMSVNAEGMFLGMKHAVPVMERSGGGSVINVASTAAVKAYANMSAYCASKAAVNHMTKAAALELATSGVRVNSVLPGIIRTPAYENFPGVDVDEMAAATVPLAFVGEPEDVADLVLYLASDDSRYVTGAQLVIDGGQAIA